MHGGTVCNIQNSIYITVNNKLTSQITEVKPLALNTTNHMELVKPT